MTMERSDYDRTDTGTYDYTSSLAAGAEVYGADNEKIGHVADVGQNYFLVQKGWLFIRDLYLPTSLIARADADRVFLNVTKDQAEAMARDELPATGDAWYGTERTGEATATPYADRERVADTTYGTDREVREGENVSVPVVEEQLKAGVRETEAGRARIVKEVREEQQSIDVPVEREEVYVTEREVDRPATQADLATREREVEIPLKEQEVVTQKEARVTGEVQVRKERVRDTERVSDTVRREDVHVEGADSERVHVQRDRGTTARTRDTGYTATDRMADSNTTAEPVGSGDATGMNREIDPAYTPTDRDADLGYATDRMTTTGYTTGERTTDTGYRATGRTDAAAYDDKYTVSGEPTDAARDRGSMAGDRDDTTDDRGILERAKEKLREADDDLHNR